jgi:predicted enzyme related to lactoylglutathione lyase
MASVLGVGGIFFKSKDPKALGKWYAKWLNMKVDAYGATLQPANYPPGGFTVWSPFSSDTNYFSPSTAEFMINLIVDDLEQALDQVKEGGAQLVGDIQQEDYGDFGWFIDPDGNKIELWQPKVCAM